MKTFAFIRLINGYNRKYYNGYVGIVEDKNVPNSYFTRSSDDEDILDNHIYIHGGITFDGRFDMTEPIIPLTDIPKGWNEYRIVGFDTNHSGDSIDNWTFVQTKNKTLYLQKQIEEIILKNSK